MNQFTTGTGTVENTGHDKHIEVNYGAPKKILVCPAGYSIATEAAALLEATYKTAIRAASGSRIYPFPSADEFTNQATEAKFYDSPLGGKRWLQDGKYGYMINVLTKNIAEHRKLKSFNGHPVSVFEVDTYENILGWTNETLFKAFTVTEFNVGDMVYTDGSKPRYTPVTIVYADTAEWNKYGASIKPSAFIPSRLDGITDVTLAILAAPAPTTSSFKASVYRDNIATTDSACQVVGLVAGDFVLKTSAAVVVTPTSVTDNGDGTYTFASTAAFTTASTLEMDPPSTIGLVDEAIEYQGTPATLTIS